MFYLRSSVWIGLFVVFLQRNNRRTERDAGTQCLLPFPLPPPIQSFIIFKPLIKSVKCFLLTTQPVIYVTDNIKVHFCDHLF